MAYSLIANCLIKPILAQVETHMLDKWATKRRSVMIIQKKKLRKNIQKIIISNKSHDPQICTFSYQMDSSILFDKMKTKVNGPS